MSGVGLCLTVRVASGRVEQRAGGRLAELAQSGDHLLRDGRHPGVRLVLGPRVRPASPHRHRRRPPHPRVRRRRARVGQQLHADGSQQQRGQVYLPSRHEQLLQVTCMPAH